MTTITTTQEALRVGIIGVLKQGRPSIRVPEDDFPVRCCYRGPGGLKCAVGFLIPDEQYIPEMDCVGDVTGLANAFFLFPQGVEIQALQLMQQAHDDAALDLKAGFNTKFISNLREYFAGSEHLPTVNAVIEEGLKACGPNT